MKIITDVEISGHQENGNIHLYLEMKYRDVNFVRPSPSLVQMDPNAPYVTTEGVPSIDEHNNTYINAQELVMKGIELEVSEQRIQHQSFMLSNVPLLNAQVDDTKKLLKPIDETRTDM